MAEDKTKVKEQADSVLKDIFGEEAVRVEKTLTTFGQTSSKSLEQFKQYMEKYQSKVDEMYGELKKYKEYGVKELDKVANKSLPWGSRIMKHIPGLEKYARPKSMFDILYAEIDVLKGYDDVIKKTLGDVQTELVNADNAMNWFTEKQMEKINQRNQLEVKIGKTKKSMDAVEIEYKQLADKDLTSMETATKEQAFRQMKRLYNDELASFDSINNGIKFTVHMKEVYSELLNGLEVQQRQCKNIYERYTIMVDVLDKALKTEATLDGVQGTMHQTLGLWNATKDSANIALDMIGEGIELTAKITDSIMGSEYIDKANLAKFRERWQNAEKIMNEKAIKNYKESKGIKDEDGEKFTPRG